ncbi:MAG: RNA polymerase sigma factor [Gemmatimonadota bacterium]|nr:RNA polymerase sigma factor [Gemmatimonadota bacterium]
MDARDIVQHYETIRRYLRRHTSTPEDADDITQTVFAEAAARRSPVDTDQPPTLAWLYTVARRRSIDLARKQRREPTSVPIDDALTRIAAADSYGSEVRHALEHAIHQLPPSQRGVVVRRLILGWTFAEIAHVEGATEAACKMRFVRGLTSIRETLGREWTRS